jgi:hypothetical protein
MPLLDSYTALEQVIMEARSRQSILGLSKQLGWVVVLSTSL